MYYGGQTEEPGHKHQPNIKIEEKRDDKRIEILNEKIHHGRLFANLALVESIITKGML